MESSPLGSAQTGKIGHYSIVEQIGEGGMGEVYSAVRSDGQFEQKVAIKLVRAGADSKAVLDRFRNERQILASLDHPNIARLLDGGSAEDGTPYLVMELVSGSPIDVFCDKNKLSITRRLELFRQVCSAVQYAHQHLVIHRDIKPANILVTENGTPKLLDFGIAKLVDASGTAAATMARSFTPDYASPEQVRGDAISTASDSYSLGVVLFRLLTGRSPYRMQSPSAAKLANAITSADPERPSTSVTRSETLTTGEGSRELTPEFFSEVRETTPSLLQRQLRGDLDYILLKTLRKEPQHRYASVEQFSEDIRKHLAGLPISARKGTWNYRAGKFLRRHKAAVAATALVAATLIVGLFVTLREARIAEASRRKADARFNDVRKLANSLIFDVHDSIQTLPGATDSRKLILQKAVEYLDGLAADTQNDPALMRDLVVGYSRIAEVEGNPRHPNLGDTRGALANYQKALALEENLARMFPNNLTDQSNLAQLYAAMTEVNMAGTGNIPEAIRYSRQAVPLFEKLVAANPNNLSLLQQTIEAYSELGQLQVGNGLTGTSGTVEAGIEALEKSLVYEQLALKLNPSNVPLRGQEGGIDIALGDAYLKLGKRAEAEQTFRNAWNIYKGLDPKGENIRILHNAIVSVTKIGDALMLEGKYDEALRYYRQGLDVGQRLKDRDPHNESIVSELVIRHGQVGLALARLGRFGESNQEFRAATSVASAIASQSAIMRIIRSTIAIWYGQSLERQKKFAEAEHEFTNSKATFKSLAGGRALDARTQTYLGASEIELVVALTGQDRFPDAEKEINSAIASLESLAAAAPPQQELLYTLAESYTTAGDLFSARTKNASKSQRLSDWKISRAWYQKSLDTWSKIPNPAGFTTYGLRVATPNEVNARLGDCNQQIKALEVSVR